MGNKHPDEGSKTAAQRERKLVPAMMDSLHCASIESVFASDTQEDLDLQSPLERWRGVQITSVNAYQDADGVGRII